MFAARGYQVVLQSVRGTFGSGGDFDPTVSNEAADGADTIAWLRQQPWYTGTFVTAGISLPRYGAVGPAVRPPRIWRARSSSSATTTSRASWGTGAFAVNDHLLWSYAVTHQEDPWRPVIIPRSPPSGVIERTSARVPLVGADRQLLGDGAPWWEGWFEHPDVDDPYWDRHSSTTHSTVQPCPCCWWAAGGTCSSADHRAIPPAARPGVDVALTIGPWTHGHMTTKGRTTGSCGDADLAGPASDRTARPTPESGAHIRDRRRWLAPPSDWPPATTAHGSWNRSGTRTRRGRPPVHVHIRSAPTHPTIGGPLLSNTGGYLRDERLAESGMCWRSPASRWLRMSTRTAPQWSNCWTTRPTTRTSTCSSGSPKWIEKAGPNVSDGYRRLVLDGGGANRFGWCWMRSPTGSGPAPGSGCWWPAVRIHGFTQPGHRENQGSGHPMQPATHTIHHAARRG